MKGLLYRELYLSRKYYLTSLGVLLLFILLCSLVQLSMNVGNLAHVQDPDVLEMLDPLMYMISMYFIPLIALSMTIDTGVINADHKCRWNLFSRCLPVTALQHTSVKFLIKGMVFLAVMLLSVLNDAVFSYIAGKPYGMEEFLNLFLIADIFVLTDVISFPLVLRAKSQRGLILAKDAGFLVVYIIGMVLASLYMSDYISVAGQLGDDAVLDRMLEDLNALRKGIICFTPLIFIILEGINFGLSYLSIKRREK